MGRPRGGAFSREARLRDAAKEPFVLSFPRALAKDDTGRLGAAGFCFNKLPQHWEGLARFEEGGKSRKGNAAGPRRPLPCSGPGRGGAERRGGVTAHNRPAYAAVRIAGGIHAHAHAVRNAGFDVSADFFTVVVLTLAFVGFHPIAQS